MQNKSFSDLPSGLRHYMSTHPDEFKNYFVTKLVSYEVGAEESQWAWENSPARTLQQNKSDGSTDNDSIVTTPSSSSSPSSESKRKRTRTKGGGCRRQYDWDSLTAEQISKLPDSEFEPNDFDNESVASYSSNGTTSTRGASITDTLGGGKRR